MNMELSSQKRKLSVIRIIIVSVICVLSVSYAWSLLVNLSKGKGATHVLNYGWDVRVNDQTYSGVDLRSFYFKDIKRGDTVELSCMLPGDIPFDSNLIVPIHYYDARVYVNGELRMEADTDRYDRNQGLGSGFYVVKLAPGSAGKELIIIIRAGEKHAFSSLASPEIWRSGSFYQDYASGKALYLALSFFFIVVGMAMMIMALAQEFRGTFAFADSVRFLSLSLLAMAFGIWIFTGMNLSEIFTSDIITKVETNYIAFFFIPIFFIGFHFESGRFKDAEGVKQARRRNILFGVVWLVGLAYIAIVLFRYYSLGESLRTNLIIAHIYDAIVIFMLVFFRFYDLYKGKNNHQLSSYATIMTGLAALTDLIRYNYFSRYSPRGSSGFTVSITCIVMIFFVLSLFFDYMSTTIMDAREEERIGLISKLAYTDSLTGLNNRQATERFFDNIDASGEQYITVQFDLNDLKKANDTYGHEEGDKYITLFADTLKSIFDGKGYIARTGGDEFIYVMIPKAEGDRKWLESKLKDLNAILANKDTGHSGLRMSTAYGSYDSFDGEAKNIRDGLRIADARMYEMKKAMKAGR